MEFYQEKSVTFRISIHDKEKYHRLLSWLDEHHVETDDEDHYNNHDIDLRVRYVGDQYSIGVTFSHADDAMLFKLAWSEYDLSTMQCVDE